MNIFPTNVWRWRVMYFIERALLTISIFCGVSYLLAPFFFATQIRAYWPVNAAVKGLAVATLALLALRVVRGRDGKLLGVALAFSSLGDILLALRNGNYFAFGLLSFLVAHLFFITLWVRNWSHPINSTARQKLLLASLVFFLLAMLWWMLPVPDGLSIPVAVYMCVLTTMASAAVLMESKNHWISTGAILFLISDSIIGLSTFKNVVGGWLAAFLIWSTYYLAQYFMTFGFMAEHRGAK